MLREAPADLQLGRYSPRGPQVTALVPSMSPRNRVAIGSLGVPLWYLLVFGVSCCSHWFRSQGPMWVTSGAPGCALLGLPGPTDSQLLSLPLVRGGGSGDLPWVHPPEVLSQPSLLPTSVSTWHLSGSLHAKPGEAWNGDPVHKLDAGT